MPCHNTSGGGFQNGHIKIGQIKILKIGTPKIITVLVLKMEQFGVTMK